MNEDKAQKILVTIPEAAEMLSVSRSKFYEILNAGRIGSVYVDKGCRRVRVKDLESFCGGGGLESAPEGR